MPKSDPVRDPRTPNLIGQPFDHLRVRSFAGYRSIGGQRKAVWNCTCTCGNVVQVLAQNLTTGNTRSCGCIKRTTIGDLPLSELLS